MGIFVDITGTSLACQSNKINCCIASWLYQSAGVQGLDINELANIKFKDTQGMVGAMPSNKVFSRQAAEYPRSADHRTSQRLRPEELGCEEER
jgi:hypothetical protein